MHAALLRAALLEALMGLLSAGISTGSLAVSPKTLAWCNATEALDVGHLAAALTATDAPLSGRRLCGRLSSDSGIRCGPAAASSAASYLQFRGTLQPAPPGDGSSPEPDRLPRAAADAKPVGHPTVAAPTPLPQALFHGIELLVGIALGVLLSVVATCVCCWPSCRSSQGQADQAPEAAPPGLSGGRLILPYLRYNGAHFRQFNWSLEHLGARGGSPVVQVSDSLGQEVARASGRLMATPNGEMHLESRGSVWCVLKRPAPSRRPGQLWDFKVCLANGTPYAEVRQMSETKCVVDLASTQRKVMTVIGNFTYPVFLSGDRSLHVWIVEADGQPTLGAQVEARSADELKEAAGEVDKSSETAEAQSTATTTVTTCLGGSEARRRFHATTTATTDASLVLAVLLGLEDVHSAARRRRRLAEEPGGLRENDVEGGTGPAAATAAARRPLSHNSGSDSGEGSGSSVGEEEGEALPQNPPESTGGGQPLAAATG
mmetsp:Transcript_130693/g.279477  ORF Transcript_130693/g.279477 Transcript_130693/m.279477 type:complete len:489 (+) Transcript_130693:175-1641(+)